MPVEAAEVLANAPGIDIPRLLVVLLTAGIIFFLSIDLVRAKGKPSVDSPSSFFPLDKVISKAAFSVVYLFFSGTISVLYAAVALDSGNVLSTVRKLLGEYVKKSASQDLKPSVEALFAAIPSWFEPLFVFMSFCCCSAIGCRRGFYIYGMRSSAHREYIP
ncbi:hypothetical protein IHQ71_05995 [Rhizobium sp. TH2]|uniref:hypothetical protein n=1 Tax=Rhizobium sp. TH2 TaxID=2775403 RepID=UPI0021588261|nr:hypothetical protein [Rhizobium sp. TH2]UVC10156.1 hypothetical protein IHQ71_05995 [Rhizobium sp. TH2]